MPFDLSVWKLLVLGIIGLVVFGPDRLPQLARDAGRTVRQLRKMAQAASCPAENTVGSLSTAALPLLTALIPEGSAADRPRQT